MCSLCDCVSSGPLNVVFDGDEADLEVDSVAVMSYGGVDAVDALSCPSLPSAHHHGEDLMAIYPKPHPLEGDELL